MMAISNAIAETAFWAFIGTLIVYSGYRFFDKISPINFRQEIMNGNIAAGIVIGSLIISLTALVVAVLIT
ncbi:MAG: DUF350 domain-containing protein [Cyanobacteria bacterium P01_H01_bin.15]